VALGAAWLADLAGLALPIGAFIAGMVIGGSDSASRRRRFAPFRDIPSSSSSSPWAWRSTCD
jgi:CPA2 family monovalent cation:H+ antiporter-2